MSHITGQPVTAVVQRIEIHKLRQGDHLILGFSIGGGVDQDPGQNPFSDNKADKGIYVTRITPGGPADNAGLQMGDKIMQVNGWDMTMVTHDHARKRLTKMNEEVVRLLVTRKSLEEAVKQSMGIGPRQDRRKHAPFHLPGHHNAIIPRYETIKWLHKHLSQCSDAQYLPGAPLRRRLRGEAEACLIVKREMNSEDDEGGIQCVGNTSSLSAAWWRERHPHDGVRSVLDGQSICREDNQLKTDGSVSQ